MKRAALKLGIALAALALAGPSRAADGAAVYSQVCSACHQPAGVGAPGLAPPLVGSLGARATKEAGRRYLAQVVVHGLSGRIVVDGTPYNGVMPGQGHLSDEDLAATLTHLVRDLPGNATAGAAPFTAAEIAAVRAARPGAKDLRDAREASNP